MKISAIVAVSSNNGIGAGGKLLAPNPVDMAFFCGYTMGKVVVVGRKTAESIGKELKGRDVVCASRQNKESLIDSLPVDWIWGGECLDDLFSYADGRDIVVCGGSEIYNRFSNLYDEIVVTELYQPPEEDPDAWFDVDLSGYTATEIFTNKRFQMKVVRYDRDR